MMFVGGCAEVSCLVNGSAYNLTACTRIFRKLAFQSDASLGTANQIVCCPRALKQHARSRKSPVTIKIQKTYSMSTKVSTSDRRESNLSNGTTSNESNDVENTFFDDEEPFVGGDDMIEIKNEPIFREDDEEDIIDQPQEQAITDDVIPDIVVQPVIMPNNEIFNFDKTVDIGPDLRDDDDVEEETILGF